MKIHLVAFLFILSCLHTESGKAEDYQDTEAFAIECDQKDSLSHLRELFFIPNNQDGTPQIYFCGHSLGLQPKGVQQAVQAELYGNSGGNRDFGGPGSQKAILAVIDHFKALGSMELAEAPSWPG